MMRMGKGAKLQTTLCRIQGEAKKSYLDDPFQFHAGLSPQ